MARNSLLCADVPLRNYSLTWQDALCNAHESDISELKFALLAVKAHLAGLSQSCLREFNTSNKVSIFSTNMTVCKASPGNSFVVTRVCDPVAIEWLKTCAARLTRILVKLFTSTCRSVIRGAKRIGLALSNS